MAREFYISFDDLYDEQDCEILIKDYDTTKLINLNIRNGDLIIFNKSGKYEDRYRNEDVYIWNDCEKRIQYLNYEIDDYGSVPNNFKVGDEFSPNHWQDCISHNNIIHLQDNLYHNLVFTESANHFKTIITIQEQKYELILFFLEDRPSLEDINTFMLTYPYMNHCEDKVRLYCRYQ